MQEWVELIWKLVGLGGSVLGSQRADGHGRETVMPYRVVDVVLHTPEPTEEMLTVRPIEEEVCLGNEVRIAPVVNAVSREILALCNPHRLKSPPAETSVVRYGFIRGTELSDKANPYAFDGDGRLTATLAVSRLVHPTSIGFGNSARLILDDDDNILEAVPGHIKGTAAFAYVADPNRNWLTKTEGLEVGKLLGVFLAGEGTRPERVTRALWRHEYAAQSKYLDVRWLYIVSALEALFKITYPAPKKGQPRSPGSTKQFVARTVGVASRYTVHGFVWTAADAEEAYRLRSDVAHGLAVKSAPPQLPLYIRMETLLRHVLTEALSSAAFASIFSTDATIEQGWLV